MLLIDQDVFPSQAPPAIEPPHWFSDTVIAGTAGNGRVVVETFSEKSLTRLSPFDIMMLDTPVTLSFLYPTRLDEDKLKDALARALEIFPQLGARLFSPSDKEIYLIHEHASVKFCVASPAVADEPDLDVGSDAAIAYLKTLSGHLYVPVVFLLVLASRESFAALLFLVVRLRFKFFL